MDAQRIRLNAQNALDALEMGEHEIAKEFLVLVLAGLPSFSKEELARQKSAEGFAALRSAHGGL